MYNVCVLLLVKTPHIFGTFSSDMATVERWNGGTDENSSARSLWRPVSALWGAYSSAPGGTHGTWKNVCKAIRFELGLW